jgi:SAM-dependent methyltransferase
LRRFRKWLPDDLDATCIDLGCGTGDMLYMLEREGYTRTSGVNLCEEELEQGRAFVRGDLIHADAIEFLRGRDPASSDLITAVNFLEHFPKDELLEMLRQARRVLRPGGTLVAMVPNAVSPFGQLTRYWDITHEWAFTPNNFRQLAPLAGFEPDVELRECGPVPHGLVSAARYALWQAIRLGIAIRFLIELGSTKDRVYTMDMLVRLRAPAR